MLLKFTTSDGRRCWLLTIVTFGSIEDELDEKKDPLRSWIRRRRKGVRVTAYDAAKSAVHRASCPDNIVTLCSNQEPVRGLGHSLSPPPPIAPKFINNPTLKSRLPNNYKTIILILLRLLLLQNYTLLSYDLQIIVYDMDYTIINQWKIIGSKLRRERFIRHWL